MTLSESGKVWRKSDVDLRQVEAMTQKYGLPEIVARITSGRGISLDNIDDFLNPKLRNLMPDPSSLKDVDLAVSRILKAREGSEKIAIFGDYDVDGATSSALLYRFLKFYKFDLEIYIPDRMKEGYGPNVEALAKLKQSGCSLVITLDCGTNSFQALGYAKEIGLDVIVIDHHAAEVKLPEAVAIVNPNRLDDNSDAAEILSKSAAVAITFMVAVAVNRAIREEVEEECDLMSLLDLVALGTVCDVMPLTGLNRAFVSLGLKILAKRQNLGLKSLSDIAGIDELPNCYHLGFLLGPRINAGGRVGKSDLGSRLLTTEDPLEADEIARELDLFNRQRKEIEDAVLEEAKFQAEGKPDSYAMVLSGDGWHEGVIGIVAGRIKDSFNKPTCVIGIENGMGKGSCRSIPGFDIGGFIHNMKHKGIIEKGGGHPMAAGLSIAADKIDEFSKELSEAVERAHLDADLTPSLRIDADLSLGAVTMDLAMALDMLAPFGTGNPNPKFVFEDVVVVEYSIMAEQHLRLSLRQLGGKSVQAVAFRVVNTKVGDLLMSGARKPVDIVGSIKTNRWGGNLSVQLIIDDVMLSAERMREAV